MNNKKVFKILLYTFLTILGLIFIFYLGNFIKISTSDEYDLAKKYVKSNKKLIDEIGKIKEFGVFPTGSIREQNGKKFAQIHLNIKASKESGKIILTMLKKPNEDWEYIDMKFNKDD